MIWGPGRPEQPQTAYLASTHLPASPGLACALSSAHVLPSVIPAPRLTSLSIDKVQQE